MEILVRVEKKKEQEVQDEDAAKTVWCVGRMCNGMPQRLGTVLGAVAVGKTMVHGVSGASGWRKERDMG